MTAGNASVIADGAAALILVSAERASELGLRVSVKNTCFIDICRIATDCQVQDLQQSCSEGSCHGLGDVTPQNGLCACPA